MEEFCLKKNQLFLLIFSWCSYYLDEYTFRFNRRTSKSRGKLFYRLAQQAMMVDSVPGKDLKAEIPALDDEDFDDLSF